MTYIGDSNKFQSNKDENAFNINEDEIMENKKYSLTHKSLNALFVLMGMGVLFPYNALITCVDYFAAVNPHEKDVAGQIAASCISALLITTLLLMPFSTSSSRNDEVNDVEKLHILPLEGTSKHKLNLSPTTSKAMLCRHKCVFTPELRTMTGYGLSLLLLLALPLLPPPSDMQMLNTLSFFIGVADAIAQSGLYVYAASYHQPTYSASVTLGSAVSGLVVSLFSLVVRGMYGTNSSNADDSICNDNGEGGIEGDCNVDRNDEEYVERLRKSTDVLFFLSSGVMVVCMVAFGLVVRDRYRQLNAVKDQVLDVGNGDEDDGGGIDDCDNEIVPPLDSDVAVHRNRIEPMMQEGRITDNDSEGSNISNESNEQPPVKSGIINHPRITVYYDTLRITWKPTFSAFLNFFITLSLFPGTITSIPPNNFTDSNDDVNNNQMISLGNWLPVVLIAIFNASDCLGRVILGVESWSLPKTLLMQRDDLGNEWSRDNTAIVQNDNTFEDTYDADEADSPSSNLSRAAATTKPTIPGHVLLPNYDKLVWYPTLGRLCFYPLLILCARAQLFFTSDLLRCLIVFVFGLTNGFVQCANFMVGPVMVQGEEKRDASSLLLLLSIYMGLTCGAYFGLVVVDKVFVGSGNNF